MTAVVRTVLGDVAPDVLGVTDSHDHLFMRSLALAGEELDDAAAARAELDAFRAAGGRTFVQWTPRGLGRRRADLAELSRVTGVNVVAATGLHRAVHYAADVLTRELPHLAERFVDDLTTSSVRAGIIKTAGAFHAVDAHARRVFEAAAEAHHATGAPIGVHLEHGTAALEVLDLLCERMEVPPGRVILGHLNRDPNSRVHLEAARYGCFLGFDGPSRANHATDWRLFDVLGALAEAGCTGQVLLGGDTTTASARAASGGGPGVAYLLTTLRPRLEGEFGGEFVRAAFEENPARAFAVEWRR